VRLPAIDALRGFIMVLMALDHANMFVARAHSSGEFWAGAMPHYDGALPFFARFVTHLCASGFFFLMGSSMTFWAGSRRNQGWSEGRIVRHFLVRGALLVAINLTIENVAWLLGSSGFAAWVYGSNVAQDLAPAAPGVGGDLFLGFGVLTGLGLAMIVGALFLRLDTIVVAATGLLAVLATQVLIPDPSRTEVAYPLVVRLLLIPGRTPHALVMYPLVPWLGLVAAGQLFGRLLLENQRRTIRVTLPAGLVLVAVALVVRTAGGFGNIRPAEDGGWMAFLNFVKYPPSLVFVCWTLGVDLLLLSCFARMLDDRSNDGELPGAVRPLVVFGRSALFFYVVHLYLYGSLGLLLGPEGVGVVRMLPFWLAGLVLLYPLCRSYERFKWGKPADSLWRLF
jgi:uncharacterized membrane protein